LNSFLRDPLLDSEVETDHVALETELHHQKRGLLIARRECLTFEKAALAYALAVSVQLEYLEKCIDRSIAKTREIPERMAQTGVVTLDLRVLSRIIGEVFTLRGRVNLHTDLLDTPDLFWDHSYYEELFFRWREYFDIEHRLSVSNQRFAVLQDMLQVFERDLNERHAHRLEVIVVLLCVFSVVIMFLRLWVRRDYQIVPLLSIAHYVCQGILTVSRGVVVLSVRWISGGV